MGKQPSARKSKPEKRNETDLEPRLVEAMFQLVSDRGWRGVSLNDIRETAGVSLAAIHPDYPSKLSILAAFMRRIDQKVLEAKFGFSPEDTTRDRLFDVLMRRFDALKPHREAIRRIRGDLRREPLHALAALRVLGCSMAWMLEAAGIGADGPAGKARVCGLTGVWLDTMRVWVDDDTQDMARTMSALDRNLGRAASCANIVFRPARRPQSEAA